MSAVELQIIANDGLDLSSSSAMKLGTDGIPEAPARCGALLCVDRAAGGDTVRMQRLRHGRQYQPALLQRFAVTALRYRSGFPTVGTMRKEAVFALDHCPVRGRVGACCPQDAFEVMRLPRRVHRHVRLTRFYFDHAWSGWSWLANRLPTGMRRERFLSVFGAL